MFLKGNVSLLTTVHIRKITTVHIRKISFFKFFFLIFYKPISVSPSSPPPFFPPSPHSIPQSFLREQEVSYQELTKFVTALEAGRRPFPLYFVWARYPSIGKDLQRTSLSPRYKSWSHCQWPHKLPHPLWGVDDGWGGRGWG